MNSLQPQRRPPSPPTAFLAPARALLALALLACSAAVPAQETLGPGGTGGERLQRFFDGLHAITAGFEQTVTAPDNEVVQQTRGTLEILRPGRFRWHYEKPYEQLIVSDGKTLWVYEPDLDQVTESRLDGTIGNTPGLLLSTEQPLAELFTITEFPEHDGLAWVRLEPKEPDTNFTRILMGFDAATLQLMELRDSFGQTIAIRFHDLQRNPRLDPGLFTFTPPPGVDVIGSPRD